MGFITYTPQSVNRACKYSREIHTTIVMLYIHSEFYASNYRMTIRLIPFHITEDFNQLSPSSASITRVCMHSSIQILTSNPLKLSCFPPLVTFSQPVSSSISANQNSNLDLNPLEFFILSFSSRFYVARFAFSFVHKRETFRGAAIHQAEPDVKAVEFKEVDLIAFGRGAGETAIKARVDGIACDEDEIDSSGKLFILSSLRLLAWSIGHSAYPGRFIPAFSCHTSRQKTGSMLIHRKNLASISFPLQVVRIFLISYSAAGLCPSLETLRPVYCSSSSLCRHRIEIIERR